LSKETEIFPSSGVEINLARCSISMETVGVGWEGERKARVKNFYSYRVAAGENIGCDMFVWEDRNWY
jgi:hypothetical protein